MDDRNKSIFPIKIQCDDTDVFALMVHYVRKYQLKNTVLMEATKSGRQVMDIQLSIEKMVSAGYDPALILPLHAISGCDTVAAYFGTLRRHSMKYPTETKKLSIIGDLELNYSINCFRVDHNKTRIAANLCL